VPQVLPDVVARVNGQAIAKSELENAVKGLEGRAGGPVPAEQRDQVLRGVLDDLIAYTLLSQQAKAEKTTVSDKDIDARVTLLRGPMTDDQFKQALTAQKISLQKLRDDTRAELAVEKYIEAKVGSKAAVTDAQINDFYKNNQDKFKQGPQIRASHILITVAANADAATKAAAKAKAEGILKDVKSGKDFAALAKANSQDPGSAANGGDLGYFQQGQMVPQFEQAAQALKPGQTSDVVESQFGFHIIKVVDKKEPRTVPLEEVKAQVQQYLSAQNRTEQTRTLVTELRSKSKIDVLM
jgi:peptidyl-prolyl cis-trans isomerase C